MKKIKIFLFIIVLIVASLVFGFFLFEDDYHHIGTIETTNIDISSRLASVVSEIEAREGQSVKKGESLINLDCKELKIKSELANSNFNRSYKLYKSGTVSQEIFDNIKNQKKILDLKLSWCDVKSPVDGKILNKYVEEGEWVVPGMRLIQIAKENDTWAYIYLPASYIPKLKIGDKIVGIIPELKNKKFKGTITKINEEAEFTPKNVQTMSERERLVFGVKIKFENDEKILKPGMSIEILLPYERKTFAHNIFMKK